MKLSLPPIMRVIPIVVVSTISCGKIDFDKKKDPEIIYEPYYTDRYTNTSQNDQDKSQSATLTVIPTDMILDGVVNFTLNSNGLISYSGYVTYKACSLCPEMTQGFRNKYKADPASLLSETYNQLGKKHEDFKLQMEVTDLKDNLKVVNTTVREMPGVNGRFEIDTSNKFIDIEYAEIDGEGYAEGLMIRLKK